MAILWRNNPRNAPRGLVYSITHRAYVTAGPDIQTYLYWGEYGPIATGQGSQSIDAVGTIISVTAGVAQGSQTIDAVGIVKADGPTTTGQGSATTDAVMAQVLDATGVVAQGSQSIQAYGDAHTPIPYYGGPTLLWRVNPRNAAISLIHSFLTNGDSSSTFDTVALELFFGTLCDIATGQGSQSIAATGNVVADATQGAGQGGQTIDAAGDVLLVSTASTGQGSQSIAAAGLVEADATATTAQGSQSVNASSVSTLDATVTTGQGSQSINAITPAHATTGQGKQSIAAAGTVTPRYIRPTGYDAQKFGTANVHNYTQYIDDTSFDSLEFGTATVVGPRIIRGQGADQALFGDANVSNKTQYITPTGFSSQRFGLPSVFDPLQRVYPEGFDSLEFPPVARVDFPPFEYFQPSEFDSLEFGTAQVYNGYDRVLYVLGFDSAQFGTATLEPHDIYPAGFNSAQFGTAWVSNKTRYITPTGFDSLRTNTPRVEFKNRSLHAVGWDSAIVWYQFGPLGTDGSRGRVEHGPQYIYPVGFDNSELDGCLNLHPFIGEPTVRLV